ncbi:ATP-grasp domain-containing protein [Porifericola rhodea]|uniref:ATP-grasp domain-containing protein n=1 Tax=Porifericola rhodea TaxID=930972 RepID=UPI00266710A4|nr:ATP-grasp domain-containing protein [Porifericola rhodea]WKN29636.1 ATP-grasp domain-containing protein [Porifericola rhodea]
MSRKNILLIGYNDFNLKELETIEDAEQYNFIPLFQSGIQKQEEINIEKLVSTAREALEKNDVKIDAIISFFDFPFTLIAFLLCEEYGLTGPSLVSGLKCEHKFWSRQQQREVIPQAVPPFDAIDPKNPSPFNKLNVKPPFWVKPVKAFSSQLGFRIENEADYQESMRTMAQEIGGLAKPFNYFLERADMPEDVKKVDGNYALAEGLIGGHQCTVSGYVYEGEVYSYGLVDSVCYDGTPSFFYYMLPSSLSKEVQQRMDDLTRKVMKQTGFNNSTFNIEFFYEESTDNIYLLEINPRMSQSHSDMYDKIKGHSNHQVLVKLALGEKPHFKEQQGPYNYAAKFQYRVFEDGVVEQVPSEDKIREIEKKYPDTIVKIDVKEGQRLSDLPLQDSFSYALGVVMTGAQSKAELLEKYDNIINALDIKIK